MISCADFVAEIGSYLDGDVAPELRQHLEAHLAHCVTCQIVLDSTRKTLTIVTDSGSFELPREAFEPIAGKIMEKIRSQQP